MKENNIITVSEIEILFNLIIKKLKKDKRHSFRLTMDEYWLILSDEWTNLKLNQALP